MNARAETVSEKNVFARCLKQGNRCAVCGKVKPPVSHQVQDAGQAYEQILPGYAVLAFTVCVVVSQILSGCSTVTYNTEFPGRSQLGGL